MSSYKGPSAPIVIRLRHGHRADENEVCPLAWQEGHYAARC